MRHLKNLMFVTSYLLGIWISVESQLKTRIQRFKYYSFNRTNDSDTLTLMRNASELLGKSFAGFAATSEYYAMLSDFSQIAENSKCHGLIKQKLLTLFSGIIREKNFRLYPFEFYINATYDEYTKLDTIHKGRILLYSPRNFDQDTDGNKLYLNYISTTEVFESEIRSILPKGEQINELNPFEFDIARDDEKKPTDLCFHTYKTVMEDTFVDFKLDETTKNEEWLNAFENNVFPSNVLKDLDRKGYASVLIRLGTISPDSIRVHYLHTHDDEHLEIAINQTKVLIAEKSGVNITVDNLDTSEVPCTYRDPKYHTDVYGVYIRKTYHDGYTDTAREDFDENMEELFRNLQNYYEPGLNSSQRTSWIDGKYIVDYRIQYKREQMIRFFPRTNDFSGRLNWTIGRNYKGAEIKLQYVNKYNSQWLFCALNSYTDTPPKSTSALPSDNLESKALTNSSTPKSTSATTSKTSKSTSTLLTDGFTAKLTTTSQNTPAPIIITKSFAAKLVPIAINLAVCGLFNLL